MLKKYLYITVFIVSIIGLSIVQYQYFRIGLNLAGLQFDEKMGHVLSNLKEDLNQKNELTFLAGSVITEDTRSFSLSRDSLQDAFSHFLYDHIRSELVSEGVKTDFSYTLFSRDSIIYFTRGTQVDQRKNLLSYPLVLDGYLAELSGRELLLEIKFRNMNRYFLSQLNGLTVPSMIFIILIVLILVWVFRAFYLQKSLITSTNEFINNLTHELKTPVFSMGVATKILEGQVKEEGKGVLKMLRSQLDRLKIQIDKVLELAIIEGKKDVLNFEELDLYPVLERIALNFETLIQMEGGKFKADIKKGNYVFRGDEYHLENAINSILENAKKYASGQIDIRFNAFTEKGKIMIEVSDRGIGMSEQVQKKIFEKYFRGGNGDRHDVKGYGLGLYYVRRIVTLHRGKIEVNSEKGQGSTFILSLPTK